MDANVAFGPNNKEKLLSFLDSLNDSLIRQQDSGLEMFVIIWQNVWFQHSRL